MTACCGLSVRKRDPCQKEITVCRSHSLGDVNNDVLLPGGLIYWLSRGDKEKGLIYFCFFLKDEDTCVVAQNTCFKSYS